IEEFHIHSSETIIFPSSDFLPSFGKPQHSAWPAVSLLPLHAPTLREYPLLCKCYAGDSAGRLPLRRSTEVYRPRLLRHRVEPYAARADRKSTRLNSSHA